MAARQSTATKKPQGEKAASKKTTASKPAARRNSVAKKKTAKAPATKVGAGKKTAASKMPASKTAVSKTAAKKTSASKTAKAPASKASTPKTAKAPASKSAASKTSVKKASASKSAGFSDSFLVQQHKILLEERATYERQFRSLRDEAASLVADFESGDVQFDEESGEGDTLAVERERDLALSAQARNAVEEIDHAIAKFDLGTYGVCEVSGQPIPKVRLEAIPWARERVEYKTGGLTSR